jgi:predicted Fe-S protein YdhL (DUF1289 family)
MITPCISVCKIDKETRTCQGCGRTIDEIRDWSKYTDTERMEVMRRLGYGKRMGREEKLRRYDRG